MNETSQKMTETNAESEQETSSNHDKQEQTCHTNTNEVALLNERKFEIKPHILATIKIVLILITLHNLLGLCLSVLYIVFEEYIYATATVLSVLAPSLVSGSVSYTWDKVGQESTGLCASLSTEMTKYKYYSIYRDCSRIFESFKLNKVKYKDAIRRIEDLRYFCITNALLYSSIQLLTQCIVMIYYYNLYILILQASVVLFSLILILLCIIIFRCAFCDYKNDLGIYRVSIFIYFITLMSMSLYTLDIVSDIVITVKYIYFQHYIRAVVVFIFIIGPGIYNTWHDHYRQKQPFKLKNIQVPTMLLNLNPLFGYWTSVSLLKQTRKAEIDSNQQEQIRCYLSYIYNNFIVASSRYNECFTESCSQMIIQLSFLLLTVQFSDLQNEKLNILSSVISVLNVAVSVVLFFRSKRIKNFEEDPLPIEGMIIQFIGYIPVASRIISLSFIASLHPYLTFLCLFWHWFLIFWWIYRTNPNHTRKILLNNAGQSFFYTYTPAINSKEVEIIFQCVFFIENCAGIILWTYSKYNRFTNNGLMILLFAIVVPSLIGWTSRYFYRKYYENWIKEFEKIRDKRQTRPC